MKQIDWKRFFREVQMQEGCWGWTGAVHCQGYGVMSFGPRGGQRHVLAHRLSFEFFNGYAPDDLCVCHRCDNRLCTNPAHLFLGSRSENNLDRDWKGRTAKGSTNSQAKLSDADVREIRRRYATGKETQRALAGVFGVGSRCISKIITGTRWKCLE